MFVVSVDVIRYVSGGDAVREQVYKVFPPEATLEQVYEWIGITFGVNGTVVSVQLAPEGVTWSEHIRPLRKTAARIQHLKNMQAIEEAVEIAEELDKPR